MLALFDLPQASTVAVAYDHLFTFLTVFSTISFLIVIVALVYFISKYNRRFTDPNKNPAIHGHPVMEGAIMLLLFVIVMVIFAWGWIDYKKMTHAPANALEINVRAKKWQWDFEYTNGRAIPKFMVVPKDQPIVLIMSSSDVLHSFFVPAFRVKQDVLPFNFSKLSFTPTQTGVFQVFCTEYCGDEHSNMLAAVIVKEQKDYEAWQKTWELKKQLGENLENDLEVLSAEARKINPLVHVLTQAGLERSSAAMGGSKAAQELAKAEPAAQRGAKMLAEKGCVACHTVTGQASTGPTLKGIFGHKVELQDGTQVEVDENYLRESITNSTAKVVKGFLPVMPPYQGVLSEAEITDIVAYIKSIK